MIYFLMAITPGVIYYRFTVHSTQVAKEMIEHFTLKKRLLHPAMAIAARGGMMFPTLQADQIFAHAITHEHAHHLDSSIEYSVKDKVNKLVGTWCS